MKLRMFLSSLGCLFILACPEILLARETGPDTLRKEAINIFLDCNHRDINYIRREIPYVNYVRDAQVYIYYKAGGGQRGPGIYLRLRGSKKFQEHARYPPVHQYAR